MKCLTREEFLAADDLPLFPVPLPEELYGADVGVYVRTMTATEKSAMEQAFTDKDPTDDIGVFRSGVLVACIVDEACKRLFSDADSVAVMEKNSGALEPIFEKACELNGFREKDVAALSGKSETSPTS